MHCRYQVLLVCALILQADGAAHGDATTRLKTESFDSDPNWEGFNNHVVAQRIPTVQQDFGFQMSNFAGREKGEMGGQVWRSSTRASYAATISPKTLSQKLTASGNFAVTATSGSSGVFFGWFNSAATGSGRSDTLGFRLAGQGSGARLTLQLVTHQNQACGTKVTPWTVDKTKPKGEGRKYRPTAIRNDGTRYEWILEYDPEANAGNGQIRFSIHSASSQPREFETRTHIVALPKGYKAQGTEFDRFGLMNGEKGGNPMTIYFDDLQFDGHSEDFSNDPEWLGISNHVAFADNVQGGAHDFGFSPETNHAGGTTGELGGLVWRSGVYGYYADPVGSLSLTNRLEAKGKIVLEAAQPDSGLYLGWFDSSDKENSPSQTGSFVGVKIGGPTRVGHYFLPAYATATPVPPGPGAPRANRKRVAIEPRQGPVLVPDKMFPWSLVYDPSGHSGSGTVKATLGGDSVTLSLKKGDKELGARLNRFGIFTAHIGGSYLRIYLDDLTYTTALPGK